MWLVLWCLFIWSGKLWTVLVTSHWRLSPLLSGTLKSLFHSLTASMVSPREQKSLSRQLIWCELKQCDMPGWPCSSSHDGGLHRSAGTRPNSAQFHLSCFGIFANSSVILKSKEDVKGKHRFKSHLLISVSVGQWSQAYGNSERTLNCYLYD